MTGFDISGETLTKPILVAYGQPVEGLAFLTMVLDFGGHHRTCRQQGHFASLAASGAPISLVPLFSSGAAATRSRGMGRNHELPFCLCPEKEQQNTICRKKGQWLERMIDNG